MTQQISKIILGSTSVARQAILRLYNIPHAIVPPQFTEETISGNSARSIAKRRAIGKALSISENHQNSLIIGCDQTAEVNENMITKARTREEPRSILERLNGKEHTLYSTVVIAHGENILTQGTVTSTMKMRELSSKEQDLYLHTNEWQGCVGGYRIEGHGIHLFESIGEQTAVMGLSVPELLKQLRQIGINLMLQPAGPWEIELN